MIEKELELKNKYGDKLAENLMILSGKSAKQEKKFKLSYSEESLKKFFYEIEKEKKKEDENFNFLIETILQTIFEKDKDFENIIYSFKVSVKQKGLYTSSVKNYEGYLEKMKESLESKSESIYISRFEKEGKHKTWTYVLGQSILSGLLSAWLIDNFTDNQYLIGFGSLVFVASTGYIFYKDSKRKVKKEKYISPSIMR